MKFNRILCSKHESFEGRWFRYIGGRSFVKVGVTSEVWSCSVRTLVRLLLRQSVCVVVSSITVSSSHNLRRTIKEMDERVSGMAVIEAYQRQIGVNRCFMVGTSRDVWALNNKKNKPSNIKPINPRKLLVSLSVIVSLLLACCYTKLENVSTVC